MKNHQTKNTNTHSQINRLQSDYEILGVVSALKNYPQVEWKESITKVIAQYAQR